MVSWEINLCLQLGFLLLMQQEVGHLKLFKYGIVEFFAIAKISEVVLEIFRYSHNAVVP